MIRFNASGRAALAGLAFAVLAGACSSRTDTPLPSQPSAVGGPEANPAQRDLLYASNKVGNVYTYPAGKFVSRLTNFDGSFAICADRQGDVYFPFIYIPGGIYEFAHGGSSPIAYLGFTTDYEEGCAINFSSGSLAVFGGAEFNTPEIEVYPYNKKLGWRLGKVYPDSLLAKASFCTYDDKGNLFVDGTDSNKAFALTELPAGTKHFVTVSTNQTITAPGGLQWHKGHLLVADSGVSPGIVYQFSLSGSSATEAGSITLDGSKAIEQFWVRANRLVAADSQRSCAQSVTGCVEFYNYPAGGAPTKTISLSGAWGIALSLVK